MDGSNQCWELGKLGKESQSLGSRPEFLPGQIVLEETLLCPDWSEPTAKAAG